jgi:hypothetical protein
MADSFAEIIGWWEPKADLARAVKIPAQNVIKWKDRDFIPAEWWPDVIAAAAKLKPKRRLTADHLMLLAKRRWR